MEDLNNTIDLRFMDQKLKLYDFSILVILNKCADVNFISNLRGKSNYMIYTNGATNAMQDLFANNFLPECVIEDMDSIRGDILQTFEKRKVKRIVKSDQSTSYLEKTLYFCLEKLSEKGQYGSNSTDEELEESQKRGILIYMDSEQKFDEMLRVYNDIYKCMEQYKKELLNVDIILCTTSSLCLFLKDGVNVIFPSQTWEDKSSGYSISSLNGESKVSLFERTKKSNNFSHIIDKKIKFGSSALFRKNVGAEEIKIVVSLLQPTCLIYTSTLLSHM